MNVKIKEILDSRSVNFKNGETAVKSQVLTEDGQDFWVWGKPQIGEEFEGEVQETPYGKEFKKARKSAMRSARTIGGDPDTMIIAYAKDIVAAFINSGKIEKPEEAVKQWQNFCKAGFALYDARKKEIQERVVVENKPF